eukprot:TRINITY_DN14184_c0_g1_i1.p4 TRINITY_DN14184_c0_g1~~TRINITY_DN14184_c0_g1_i1.p4  ORF type:complete len:220 (-),score=24.79 TRINITY_DN14184_c0_g1_i1:807-1466(-)
MRTYQKWLLITLLILSVPFVAQAQLVGLALALGNTFASYLLDQYLRQEETIDIDGAPSWYGTNNEEGWYCVYSHRKGDIDSVDRAKRKAMNRMVEKQQLLVGVFLDQELEKRKLRDEAELQLVERFRNDAKLSSFVAGHLDYRRVEYEGDVKATFVKACLETQEIIAYQKKRLEMINKELTVKRSNDAFDEMDEAMDDEHSTSQNKKRDPFTELDFNME